LYQRDHVLINKKAESIYQRNKTTLVQSWGYSIRWKFREDYISIRISVYICEKSEASDALF
jgi:hypothetical protein